MFLFCFSGNLLKDAVELEKHFYCKHLFLSIVQMTDTTKMGTKIYYYGKVFRKASEKLGIPMHD